MKLDPIQSKPSRRTVLGHDVLELVGRVDQFLEGIRVKDFSPVPVHEVIALTIARDRLATKFRKMRDSVGELVTAQDDLVRACSDIEALIERVSAESYVEASPPTGCAEVTGSRCEESVGALTGTVSST